MSTSSAGSKSSTGIRLPTLPSMQRSPSTYLPSVQLAPPVWRDGRRGSIGTATDGEDEASCHESSLPIERLRLVSRSVSPVKSPPPTRTPKLHFPPTSAKRKFHPTLETAPRRLILGDRAIPSTAQPRLPSTSAPHIMVIPRTAGFRPITPMTVRTAGLVLPPTPRTVKQAQGVGRMVLVNPIIAAHLKRGGVVNVRSRDGSRKWRISLPATATTPLVESAIGSAQMA